MKKLLLPLLVIIATSISSYAQLLWEVSGNGLEKPSYLFGTHHLAPISVIDSTPGLKSVIENVDKVYGEMDMSTSMSQEGQMKILAAAQAPADSTLSKLLSPAQLDSVDSFIKSYMGPIASVNNFEPMRPALLNTTLTVFVNAKAMPDYNMQQQIDTEIQKRAAALGKEVAGFETIEDQCRALFGAPIITEAESLMEIVRDENKVIDLATRLSKAYLAGDLEGMFKVMNESSDAADKDWNDRLLNDRNANWMEMMAGLLPTASVLIAVGAGHLPGDKGLINLLRKNGYTVNPVTE